MKNQLLSASDIIKAGADAVGQRADSRDLPDGERSMRRTVEMFNALKGGDRFMTETEGWLFMACLKMARATAGRVNVDDYVDGSAYMGLAGESAVREQDGGAEHPGVG